MQGDADQEKEGCPLAQQARWDLSGDKQYGKAHRQADGLFADEYAALANNNAIFDLPLMRALTSAQFWPTADARRRVAALG